MTGLRICLAEDDHDQRWTLKSLLQAVGHNVVSEAPDGRALVEEVLKGPVDIVITDLDMPNPGRTGSSTTNHTEAQPANYLAVSAP